MTMGARIRQARLDAGLSQRRLAGEEMTRNMLSALENDSANPSVGTLRYLSEKLCKPISYFLGEDIPQIPEAAEMARSRAALQAADWEGCIAGLEGLESENFRWERALLRCCSLLELAREAVEADRIPYANQLLEQCRQAGEGIPYFDLTLQRRWLILAARCAVKPSERAALTQRLNGEDEVLELKARTAVDDGDLTRAEHLLEAMENRHGSRWNWLRGEVHFARQDYRAAAECYHRAEKDMPVPTGKRLEICYRELEDYKMAYYYATKK